MAASTPRIDNLEDPTGLSDEIATALGKKAYTHGGGPYNGGNAPTVTLFAGGGTLTTVNQADFYPYKDQDGNWRLKFNISVTLSSATRTLTDLAVDGLTFFDTGAGSGAGQGIAGGAAHGHNYLRSWVENNDNIIRINHASGATTQYQVSGDVKLAVKPTWAY